MTTTTRSLLDKEFSKLEANIVRLSSMVETAIEHAMIALTTEEKGFARQVIANDSEINELRHQIEGDCQRILATQQPAAGDLRYVIAAIHIAVELERIGDHAVGIASLAQRIRMEGVSDSFYHLPKMAKRARKMIRLAIDSYVSEDSDMAQAMMGRDQKINKGYDKLFGLAIEDMRDNDMIVHATYLLWIGHNIERMGDRAVNIAERVVYMVTGNFVESSTTDFDSDD